MVRNGFRNRPQHSQPPDPWSVPGCGEPTGAKGLGGGAEALAGSVEPFARFLSHEWVLTNERKCRWWNLNLRDHGKDDLSQRSLGIVCRVVVAADVRKISAYGMCHQVDCLIAFFCLHHEHADIAITICTKAGLPSIRSHRNLRISSNQHIKMNCNLIFELETEYLDPVLLLILRMDRILHHLRNPGMMLLL